MISTYSKIKCRRLTNSPERRLWETPTVEESESRETEKRADDIRFQFSIFFCLKRNSIQYSNFILYAEVGFKSRTLHLFTSNVNSSYYATWQKEIKNNISISFISPMIIQFSMNFILRNSVGIKNNIVKSRKHNYFKAPWT